MARNPNAWRIHHSDGTKGAAAATLPRGAAREDAGLLRACAEFQTVHAELDRLLSDEDETEHVETELFPLHRRWHDACLRAVSLRAASDEGRHAKAAMLLAVMDVVLGTDAAGHALHELLAASLARDCRTTRQAVPLMLRLRPRVGRV